MKTVTIKKSTNSQKKLMAIFYENNKKIKTIHFGAAGMSDFTKHKDSYRKQRYLNRHKNNENWNDPMTAGSLSRWILWNKPSLKASLLKYLFAQSPAPPKFKKLVKKRGIKGL